MPRRSRLGIHIHLLYILSLWIKKKIRLIENNSTCRHLKKLTCKRDFAAGVYLSKAQYPIPPSLHTVQVYAVHLVIQGRGGGGEGESKPERRLEGQQVTKLGQKDQYDQSINSYILLPRSPFTG
jgi:hypothetical protein